MIPCQELNAKREIRVKNSYERNVYQNKVLNHISTKLPKCSSPSMRWKLNTSLTQKDTMDRGAWIKIQKERHEEESKDKSPKAQNSAKWHENGEQMNIFVYHMLQSCGVQAGSYPKTEVKKWNSYFWPQKSYLDFETLVSIFLNRTTLDDSKFICHLGNPNI